MRTEPHAPRRAHVSTLPLLLTAHEVAARLGISLAWVRKLTHEKRIPHLRIGTRVLYRPSELDKWLAAHEVTAAQLNGKGSR